MINSVLIVNRGEIARRIIRTLRTMNLRACVVFDEREKDALYVCEADQAVSLGSGNLKDTFLNIPKIIAAAKELRCDAIHPGYGFLSENAEFAFACEREGINFIGPDARVIRRMGSKTEAFRIAASLGIPVIPGIYGSKAEILKKANEDFFPCLIKAAAGGGGKAMRIIERSEDLAPGLDNASREAKQYFGDGTVYLEKLLEEPRHIEVQVLADTRGNTVHLFERECSLQRRYQKVIEEAPAVSVSSGLKKKLYDEALKITGDVGYRGAGTIEFLVDKKGRYYFLEMNTRIQVEHSVTELITGVDIVAEQLRIAEGKPLSEDLTNVRIKGHAIEARLYAEDPEDRFSPSPGILRGLYFPEIYHVRIDSGVRQGDTLLPEFDPLLARITAYGRSRKEAGQSLLSALEKTSIQGVASNRIFLINTLESEAFGANEISTLFIQQNLEALLQPSQDIIPEELIALAGLYISLNYRDEDMNIYSPVGSMLGYWRMRSRLDLSLGDKTFAFFNIRHTENSISAIHAGKPLSLMIHIMDGGRIMARKDDLGFTLHWALDEDGGRYYLSVPRRDYVFSRTDWLPGKRKQSSGEASEGMNGETHIKAPLSGLIARINFCREDWIDRGESVLVVESMKMENEISLPARARIRNLFVKVGQTVLEGDLLFEVEYEK